MYLYTKYNLRVVMTIVLGLCILDSSMNLNTELTFPILISSIVFTNVLLTEYTLSFVTIQLTILDDRLKEKFLKTTVDLFTFVSVCPFVCSQATEHTL